LVSSLVANLAIYIWVLYLSSVLFIITMLVMAPKEWVVHWMVGGHLGHA
jgi:hypothetical protein